MIFYPLWLGKWKLLWEVTSSLNGGLFIEFNKRKWQNNAKKSIKGGRYFMDKKKLLATSLASVAVLGLAFATSQPSVVKAEEETTAQNEFLANFDKALDETVKALEEEAKNNPESADQIKETIANFKAEAAKNRAEFEEGFKNGLTAEAAEKEVEKATKAKEAEAQEEAAAQKEFLANYDEALKAAIAELEKAETNSPEEAKTDTIAALKAASDQTRAAIVEGFKKELTAK